jgi:hypothetical protein
VSRDRRYYYECVNTCQMGYMAPSTRIEDRGEDGVPPMVLHERSFYPAGPGKKRADYLCTEKQISRRYTQEQPRKFFKKDLRTGEIREINTPTTVKFVLLEDSRVGDYVRDHARFMTLRDCDLASSDKDIEDAGS